MKETYTQQSEA
jgi:hypothetical protein